MPYDPNDPNQGSQAPPEDQATPEAQAKNAMTSGTINDLVRSRPAIAAWMAAHRNGAGLTGSEQQELFRLMQKQGIDPRNLEIDDAGVVSWPKHTARDIALGSLLAFGPVVAAWAAPYVAGSAAAGAGGADATAAGAGAAGAADATAAGVLPSTITTAGSAALPAGLSGSAVTSGAELAGLADAGSSAFDAEGNFIGDTTISSDPTSSLASRIAGLAKGTSDLTNGISSAITGQDNNLTGIGAANAASQAARNRILGAQVDQGGPAADKTALSNMRTAGLMANFQDRPATQFGNPAITLGQPTRDLASKFQTELSARMAAGKPLTLSGVPAPGAQELADEAAARSASQGRSTLPGTAGKTVNGINTGSRLAQQAKTLYDLWQAF